MFVTIGYAIAGLIIGLFIAESFGRYGLSAIAGAVLGIVFARLLHLQRRVNQLESTRQKPQPQPASAWGQPVETEEPVAPAAKPVSPWQQAKSETAALRDTAPSGEALLRQSREDELKTARRADSEWKEIPGLPDRHCYRSFSARFPNGLPAAMFR